MGARENNIGALSQWFPKERDQAREIVRKKATGLFPSAHFARVSLGCMQMHPTHNTTRASGEQKSLHADFHLVSVLKDGAKFLSQSNYNAQVKNCPNYLEDLTGMYKN